MTRFVALAFLVVLALDAQPYARGVGIYPGNPKEDFAPRLVPETRTYRNLALHRPAYQSSSYDYNLTAQLITDGIKETAMPRWVAVSDSDHGTLSKQEREHVMDHNPITALDLKGPRAWVQIELAGGEAPLEVDRVQIQGRGQSSARLASMDWTAVVTGSDDGESWSELGRASETSRFPPAFKLSVAFAAPAHQRFFRVRLEAPVTLVGVGEIALFDRGKRVETGGPYRFTSAWKSAGQGEEWVYVDLGAVCTFDRVALHWIRRAAEGAIQISSDAKSWKTIASLDQDDVKLTKPARGRYVRVLMTRPATPDGYVLSEMEVYGRGGPLPVAQAGSWAWRVQRDSLVTAEGASLSRPGFADRDWLPATVPATVLSSYWNAGALADPNYGDNQLNISDSFFYADFWYRTEFDGPRAEPGRHVWLNFNGINWKAEVFLNGERLGRIEGGFMRGRFDVTGILRLGARNALAVRIEKNATPGSVKEKTFETPDKNGGALGADNPTYHASVGWDWIPTIRGRNTGIWSSVALTTTGPVTIEDLFVSAKPIDTLFHPNSAAAFFRFKMTLRNSEPVALSGTLRGRIGTVTFAVPLRLHASSSQTVDLDSSFVPALRMENAKLWWPAGYGEPHLYPVELTFDTGGKVSDRKSLYTGVRQLAYSEEGGALKIWINGRRFIPRGGNWGFPESMLRYRAREYDIAVRYHKEMNFTMIRNWVGQTGDDEFYEACDRRGIVVWQDFWLANPSDGPDPDDHDLFLKNARDFVLRIRNHPSVGLYCGRNEGFPPKPLDDGIRALLAELHPGMHYISSSADGVVSGHGPYRAMPQKFYFAQRATAKLHSEMGMPNIMTLDSVEQTMPPAAVWPQASQWGLHDFPSTGAQDGASFRQMLQQSYGGADNPAQWIGLAQFINYDGYRAMFEAQSKNRMGLLLWMSHPAWPSFVWQTYDYFFEPSAAYFGAKKASEPLHIQWNAATDDVEVVNYSAGSARDLTAHAEILNLDGSRQWQKSVALESPEDSVMQPIRLEYPASVTPVHFIGLKLVRGDEVVSENLYLRGVEEGNYRAIRGMPRVKVDAATQVRRHGARWLLTTELHNATSTPALMVRVKAVRAKSGDRILPAIYSDNYVTLMPGERRVIRTELEHADTRGERPAIVVDGFNVLPSALSKTSPPAR